MKFKVYTIVVTVLSLLVVSLALYIYFDKAANGSSEEKWIYVGNRTDSRKWIERYFTTDSDEETHMYDVSFPTIGKGKIVDGIIKIDIYDAYVVNKIDYNTPSVYKKVFSHIEDTNKKVSYNAADGIVYMIFDSIDELSDYIEQMIEE